MSLPTVAQLRKALVAVLGVIVEVINLGLVNGSTENWLSLVVSMAVALGVYTVKNAYPSDSNGDDVDG